MTDESQISEREREILRLVATGATNQQIAQQLNISINTVKVHLRNIFGKIGVVSRTEATLYAVRFGLVSVERAGGATAVAEEPEEGLPAEAQAPTATPDVDLVPDDPPPPLSSPLPAVIAPAAEPPPPPPTVVVLDAPPSGLSTQPAAPTRPAALNPLVIGLAAIALLAVGGLIATLLLRPAAPATTPTAAGGAPAATDGQRWRGLAPLPEPRSAFALAPASFNGASYLYAMGGEGPAGVSGEVLRYDIEADSWARYTAKPTPVADVRAAVIGGRIYVPGGRGADGSISAALEAYDPQSDTWAELAPLPAPRSRYALAAVEGKLYLFGGWDGGDFAGQVWQYSPDTDTWAELAPMPAPRADAAAATLDGQVYLLGGENAGGTLTRHERYSPADEGKGNPWAVRAPLPAPRSRLAVAATSGRLFAFGGPGGAIVYYSSRDSWEPVELPVALDLSELRAQFVGDERVYIVGGRGPDELSDAVYEYQAIFVTTLPASSN